MKKASEKSISLSGLGKRYRVYFEKPALIRSIMPFLVTQGKIQQFWALRDVSFEVEKGQCVGIIGPNGSGKSTLLSILAGVTAPTEGSMVIDGQVSSLLTLGAGFHFELTGQENIYLNAAILGLKKAQIDRIYDEIVEFADLGKFMSAKLATYSAGMTMRLGFAIAIVAPFDVLIIDEILAVGDLHFQTKCFKKMQSFYKNNKKTILFVSHGLDSIQELCTKVIWFEHGKVEQIGEPEQVLKAYKERYKEKYGVTRRGSASRRGPLKRAMKAAISVDYTRGRGKISPSLFGSNMSWSAASWILCFNKYKPPFPYGVTQIKELRLGILRYPGIREGDFFHWKEALGRKRPLQSVGAPNERYLKKIRGKDKLVPMTIPDDMFMWRPCFGPDEFNQVAEEIEAEKILVLNVATGTPEEGLSFLRYMDSIGRPVKYAELGHELYHDDHHDIGVTLPISPEEYASRVAEFSRLIRAYRPDIGIIAMACLDTGTFTRYRHPDWTEKVLDSAGEWIDYIAVHNTEVPIFNVGKTFSKPPDKASFEALMAAPLYVADNLSKIRRILGSYRERTGKNIKIAMTFYRTLFENVPKVIHGKHRVSRRETPALNKCRSRSLGSALYEAMLLNLFIREEDIDIACRAALFLMSDSAIWCVAAQPHVRNPQHEVQMLYSHLAGKTLLRTEVEVGSYHSEQVGIIPPQRDVPYLDVIAARSDEAEKLSLYVVNRSLRRNIAADILIKGFSPGRIAVRFLSADTIGAYNTVEQVYNIKAANYNYSPGLTDEGTFGFQFQPHSLTVLTLEKDDWF